MVEEDQSYYRFLKDDWKKLAPEAKLPLSSQQHLKQTRRRTFTNGHASRNANHKWYAFFRQIQKIGFRSLPRLKASEFLN